MTAETKAYIEQHINQIENNEIGYVYLKCPVRILNDFNNTMHYADICYPPEIHKYVVICCYISTRFKGAALEYYDLDYNTEKEKYEFICDNCLYSFPQISHDLSVLLPTSGINVGIEQQNDFRGITRLKILIEVD